MRPLILRRMQRGGSLRLVPAALMAVGAASVAGCNSSEFRSKQAGASGGAGRSPGPAASSNEAGTAVMPVTGGGSGGDGAADGTAMDAAGGADAREAGEGGDGDSEGPRPPLPPPLAHWRFDGNLTDSSGNGHDAERVGAITYAVTASGVGAIFADGWGRNYSFATPFRNTLDSFTLSVRLRVDAYDREMPLFGLSAPGLDSLATNKWLLHLCAEDYCAGVTSPGVVVETEVTDAGNNSYATLGPLPPAGMWVHLTLIVSENQLAYYLDGTMVSSSFYTPAETLGTVIHLGGTTSTTSSVNGAIDDIRVYDEVFDAEQVAALFAGF